MTELSTKELPTRRPVYLHLANGVSRRLEAFCTRCVEEYNKLRGLEEQDGLSEKKTVSIGYKFEGTHVWYFGDMNRDWINNLDPSICCSPIHRG